MGLFMCDKSQCGKTGVNDQFSPCGIDQIEPLNLVLMGSVTSIFGLAGRPKYPNQQGYIFKTFAKLLLKSSTFLKP